MDQWFSTMNTQANNVRLSEIFGHSSEGKWRGSESWGEGGKLGAVEEEKLWSGGIL